MIKIRYQQVGFSSQVSGTAGREPYPAFNHWRMDYFPRYDTFMTAFLGTGIKVERPYLSLYKR